MVEKIKRDGAHAILVMPEWPRRRWHKATRPLSRADLLFPKGTKFFELQERVMKGTLWATRVSFLCGHTPKCSVLKPLTVEIPRNRKKTWFHPTTETYSVPSLWEKEELSEKDMVQCSPITENICPVPNRDSHGQPLRLLDLYAGTGSASRVYQSAGWEVVTVDNDPKGNYTHPVDILSWDYKAHYPVGHFHTIVCSPPCT